MKKLLCIVMMLIACGGGGGSVPEATVEPPPAPPAPIEDHSIVQCFGTSLTYGGDGLSGIALLLGNHERELGIWVRNRGLAGHNSRMLVGHLEEATSHRDGIVLIEAVMNDASIIEELHIPIEDSRVYVTAIVRAFMDTGARVYLMTTNPEIHEPSRHPDLEDYYQMVREVAAETGATLIDLRALWSRYSYGELHEMIPDHCHPTIEALEEVVWPKLKEII